MLTLLVDPQIISEAQTMLRVALETAATETGQVVLGFHGGSQPGAGAWFEGLDF